MFQRINAGTIKSSDGFFIKIDLHTLVYQEDEQHLILLEIEHLMNPDGIAIYAKNNLHAWNASLKETLTQVKKEQIMQRIKNALNFADIKYEIE